jgi:hypothetical protein
MNPSLKQAEKTVLVVVVLVMSMLRISAAEKALVFPADSQNTVCMLDGQEYLELGFAGWGPDWAWQSFQGEMNAENAIGLAVSNTTIAASGAKVQIATRTAQTGPRQLTMQTRITTDRDTDLTMLIAGLNLEERSFGQGQAVVTDVDGTSVAASLPPGRRELGQQVRRLLLRDNQGRETVFTFEPALELTTDGDLRIGLARRLQQQQPVQASLTIDLPVPLTYYPHPDQIPEASGFDQWYAFTPDDDYETPGEFDMDDWLDAPAGKHGRIRAEGQRLLYQDRPIKLWGLNLCFRAGTAPSKDVADRRVALYRKFGINAVRLHKWADGPGWAGIQAQQSALAFDPEGLDLFDYQNAQFRQAGMFLKLSQAFGTIRVGAADLHLVPYAEEFGSLDKPGARVGGGNSTLFYSRELQDATIQQLQNILNHRNPYTGLTYAEDPAVAFVEIVNESSILFYTSMNPLKQSPTLRNRTAEHFSHWLEAKYGDQDGLAQAWGDSALDSFTNELATPDGQAEDLARANILPLGNPWFWDPDQLAGSQQFRRQRLLDTLEFLTRLQVDAYERIVAGIRQTGYEGEIIGSNWHAGRMFSHYANLYTDQRVGTIDRHNYFGGGERSRIDNGSMARIPGSGMLSTGMEQVADRPFMLSEWIHVYPNEWGAEGPAIVGAYGMGLQGWDVSYMFQNRDDGRFSSQIGRERWDVTAPQVLSLFPAVARQVLRGDVDRSEVRATRYVHMPSLLEGKLGFVDSVDSLQYDVRTFDSALVPSRALAVARCEVQFTDQFQVAPPFHIDRYVEGDEYVSSTGQLRWREGQGRHDGHFTMNTAGTKAVVGFAEDRRAELGEVTITPRCRFSAIYVTARGQDDRISDARDLLVVVMARARNTGMKVVADSRILDSGDAPVVLEPVRAEIQFHRPGRFTVHVLDHNGRMTDRTLPVEGGRFQIDGATDQTPYYLIRFRE